MPAPDAAQTPKAARRRAPIHAADREEMAAAARAFLCDRYRLASAQASALAAVPVVWARGRDHQRGRYVHGPGRGAGGPHIRLNVPRGQTTRLWLYQRVTAGLTTPPGGLVAPIRLVLTVTLVHEYTHALQYMRAGPGVPRGEVEPTRNQIRYLREYAPDLHAQLVPARRRRRQRGRPTPAEVPRPSPSPQDLRARLLRWLARRRAPRPGGHMARR